MRKYTVDLTYWVAGSGYRNCETIDSFEKGNGSPEYALEYWRNSAQNGELGDDIDGVLINIDEIDTEDYDYVKNIYEEFVTIEYGDDDDDECNDEIDDLY